MTPTLRRLVAWTFGAAACAALPGLALAAKQPLTAETEQAFWKGDFAALDKENEFLKHGKHLAPNAGSELEYFRLGLDSVIRTKVDRSEPYLRELEALTLQWAAEHPKSSLAHVLHAQVLVQHAWSYRGGGYAKEVPPQAWADFHNYLQRAAEYLKAHADVALTDSSAHALLLRIGQTLGHFVLEMLPPAPAPQRGEARRMQVAPQLTQVLQQSCRRLVGQCDAFHIHHRLREPGVHQHVAPVVHVRELVARGRPAERPVQAAQFPQGVRPEAREHQESVGRQGTMPLRDQRLGISRIVQHHVGPQHLHTSVGRHLEAGRPGLAAG